MAKDKLMSFSLEGCTPDELRDMARRHLVLKPGQADKLSRPEIVSLLSQEVATKPQLRKELKEKQISIKPSFYLLSVSRGESHRIAEQLAHREGVSAIQEINQKSFQETKDKGTASPHGRAFKLERISVNGDVVEGVITWETPLRYWERAEVPELKTVLTLEVGFFIVDLAKKYAVIACHTLAERERIAKVIEKVIKGKLTPLRLTKPLLERIGEFSKATRAAYALVRQSQQGQTRPTNIAFSDERLAQFPEVVDHEQNDEFFRAQTFYRIELEGTIVGLGVTSDTGKIWLPRFERLQFVTRVANSLLAKFSVTLNQLTRQGEYRTILETMGFYDIEPLSQFNPGELRRDICDLGYTLIEMLVRKEKQCSFVLPKSFVKSAIPSLFGPFDLRVTDPNLGEVASASFGGSSLFIVRDSSKDGFDLLSWPSRSKVPPKLSHPLTDSEIELGGAESILGRIRIFPTAKLRDALLKLVEMASTRFGALEKVVALPFFVDQNTLYLDVDGCFGRSQMPLPRRVDFSSVTEFRRAAQQNIPASDEASLRKALFRLGEKCSRMSDDVCQVCVRKRETLCLRSIVAHAVPTHLLLAHKGIERSDIQLQLTIDGTTRRALAFAKMATARTGKGASLTLKNVNGSTLLSQVVSQVSKSDFEIVVIISPSALTEDLREGLDTVCAPYRKAVLYLTFDELAKLFLECKEGMEFEQRDFKQVLRESAKGKAG